LSSAQIQDLFEAASIKDKDHNHQLLIHHPSDLLQIETTYIHDGQEVNLILHILMSPANSILCLFQLHPFPLPFNDTYFLIPNPTNQILALYSDPIIVH
jgi:hypothetical protein